MHMVEAAEAKIPAIGLGTWELRGDTCYKMVSKALELGYRHVDTAQMYENEAEVGKAIRESSLKRDEVFLTTKIWPSDFRRDDLLRAAKQRLDELQVDRVDLLLLHWPSPDVPLQETVEALNDARDEGYAKFIGVSNFTVPLMEAAQTVSRARLATNQVEYHPYLSQSTLLRWIRGEYTTLTAYSPLARGKVKDDRLLQKIGKDHGKTPGQVALRWLIQQPQVIAIPRTSNEARLQENLDVFDFALSEDEMNAITQLGSPHGRMVELDGHSPRWDA